MPHEKSMPEQVFTAFPAYSVRSKEEALGELTQACSRFRSPFTREEKVRLFVSGQLDMVDMLANATNVIAPGTPLNWRVLLRYLHEKEIITTPSFAYNVLRNDLPKFYGIFLQTMWDAKKTDGREVNGSGYGHAHSADIAMSKAVGETLERYLLSLYKHDSLLRISYDDLARRKIPALNPLELNGYLPWQEKNYARFAQNTESPVYWVKGETVDGKQTLLPAQLVYWNYDFERDKEEPVLGQPTTNAAGAHFSREEAILSGLLEHIQRDGFLIYWLNNLSPKVIDVSVVEDAEIKKVLDIIERYGLKIYFLNTTSDIGIPSVTCAIVDDRAEKPIIAIGGGTGFDFNDTILHSAYETLVVLNQVERQEDFVLSSDYRPFTGSKVGHTERLRLWRGREMLDRFSFFLKGERQTAEDFIGKHPHMNSPREYLMYVVEKLRALGQGYEPLLYEVHNEVLKTLGYHVVQTVVPQLIPLYLNENMPTLNSKRLHEVPPKLGYTASDILNPWPHPFP